MSHIAQQNPAAELRLTVPLLIWGGNDSMLDLTQLMRQLDDQAGRQPERLMNDAIELVKRANRIPMEAQNRALLLERAVRCQQFLLEKHRAARRQIGQLVASDSLGSERLLLLTEEIGFGYKRLLLSQAETFASVDEQAQTLHGAITALSQQLLLCLDLRRARSRSLWGEFHRLFHYAERMKTENQQFRDVDGAVDAAFDQGLAQRPRLKTHPEQPLADPAGDRGQQLDERRTEDAKLAGNRVAHCQRQDAAAHESAKREIFEGADGALTTMSDADRLRFIKLDALMAAPIQRAGGLPVLLAIARFSYFC